jgi:hypothetical protein
MPEVERAVGEGKKIFSAEGEVARRRREGERRGKKEGEGNKRGCGPAGGTAPPKS